MQPQDSSQGITVTITNETTPVTEGNSGAAVSVQYTFTDTNAPPTPPTLPSWTATIDWGDNSTSQATFNNTPPVPPATATHTYAEAQAQPFTVTITVKENWANKSGSTTTSITVVDQPLKSASRYLHSPQRYSSIKVPTSLPCDSVLMRSVIV
jgi:hypothetical protein